MIPSTAPVSVVVPAHNAADTLRTAVSSVLAQTVRAREIIVVDDASSDATAEVARSIDGVSVVSLESRRGAAAARNAGIAAASGAWIAFLDADDEWLPEKLERQLGQAAGQPRPSLVFCASDEYAADGRPLGDTFRGGEASSGPDAWKSLLKRNFVATPTVMAPRDLLLELRGFDESLAVGEDQDMWIRLALAGSLAYVPEPLVRVHVRTQSLSAFRPTDQSRYLLPMIKRHLGQQEHRLTASERRTILGERLCNAGRIAFVHGDFLHGAGFMMRSALLGYRPLASFATVAKAPVAAIMKRTLHAGSRRQTAP